MSARPKEYIALVGACYIDTILTTREFPKEDTKLRATSLSRRRGGNTPNSAEVLAQFATVKDGTNWAPLLISVVPDKSSADFQFIKNSLPAVDLDHCVDRSGKHEAPSSYIIRSEETSSRTIVNYNELEEMSFEEFKMVFEKIGKDVTLWHFEGRIPDVTLKCITYVREHQPSAQISVEIEKPGREGLLELSHMANYVFFSRSWATHAGFTDIRTFLAAQGETHYRNRKTSGFAFCTWAEVGSGFCNLDSSISHQDRESSDLDSDLPEDFIHRVHVVEASLPKGKAAMDIVDTVGAGDVFIASVLGQVMSKGRTNSISSSEMQRIIRIANATCGHKICQEGFQTLPVFPES